MALKKCRECGKKISTSAKSCPNCGKKNPTTSPLITAFVFIGMIWLFMWIITGIDTDSGTQAEDVNSWKDEDKIEAHVYMESFVEDRLRAPSTAEFPSAWSYDYDNNIDYEGDQTYTIRSWVDSQNGFGATVRTHFTGKIQQTSADEWTLLNLELHE